MEKEDQILSKLYGLVEDIRENMVTKSEFEDFKSGIYSHIDGFVKLH